MAEKYFLTKLLDEHREHIERAKRNAELNISKHGKVPYKKISLEEFLIIFTSKDVLNYSECTYEDGLRFYHMLNSYGYENYISLISKPAVFDFIDQCINTENAGEAFDVTANIDALADVHHLSQEEQLLIAYTFLSLPENRTAMENYGDILHPYIFMNFESTKQVYKFDKTFCEHMRQTDITDFTLTEDDIDLLPAETFFIDISEDLEFDPVKGFFAHVDKKNKCVVIENIALFNEAYLYQTFYYQLGTKVESDICDDVYIKDKNGYDKKVATSEDWAKNLTYSLLLIAYLTSKEPDVELVHPANKKATTRLSDKEFKKKTKESDCALNNVGYVFGQVFRNYEQKVADYNKYIDKIESGEIKLREGSHKPKRPHYVKGHYSHYHTGVGRQNLIKKYIEPYYTGVEPDDRDKIITIHKVSTKGI